MKWKGRRQSKNVEDRQLEDVKIPNGAEIFVNVLDDNDDGKRDGYKTFNRKKDPAAKEWDDRVRAEKNLARRGNNVPTPSPNPRTINSQVTPGKWITK